MDDMDYQEIIERRRARNRKDVGYSDELGGRNIPDYSEESGLFWSKPKASDPEYRKKVKA